MRREAGSGWAGLRALALACATAGSLAAYSAASAESLTDALAAAYLANPTLNAERARLRATDEELAKAQSGFRPDISITGGWGVQNLDTGPGELTYPSGVKPSPFQIKQNDANLQRNDGTTHPGDYAIQMSQPLFRGFRTVSGVREADASIMAARETLRRTEQRILLDAASIYMDVLRDMAIVRLREQNARNLTRELTATRDRYAAGDQTRTDVAQATARRAQAQAALELARAALRASQANYERIVGHPADGLHEPPPLTALLPASLDEAASLAEMDNPSVVAAAFNEKAAGWEVRKIEGEMLPEIRLTAMHQERFETTPWIDRQQVQAVTARVNIPLYQSGEVEARVRQAKQRRQGYLENIEEARLQSRADAIEAWSQLLASRGQVEAVAMQVRAAEEALAGVREEQRAGQRTLLDVLNAEQEQIDAHIAAARARRDLVVSSYTLLSAVGRLTADQLGLPVETYDVEAHYDEIDGKWGGITIDREPGNEGWEALVTGEP